MYVGTTLQEFLGLPETSNFDRFGKKELLDIIQKLAIDLGWENGSENLNDTPMVARENKPKGKKNRSAQVANLVK